MAKVFCTAIQTAQKPYFLKTSNVRQNRGGSHVPIAALPNVTERNSFSLGNFSELSHKTWVGRAFACPTCQRITLERLSQQTTRHLIATLVSAAPLSADLERPRGMHKRRRHSNKTLTKRLRKFPSSWRSTLPVLKRKSKPRHSFPRRPA